MNLLNNGNGSVTFTRFLTNPDQDQNDGLVINDLFEDRLHNLWIATSSSGLLRLSEVAGKFHIDSLFLAEVEKTCRMAMK